MTSPDRLTEIGKEEGLPVEQLFNELVNISTAPSRYQEVMIALGRCLGKSFSAHNTVVGKNVYVAFTVEDADFLARGLIDELRDAGAKISVACFWNRRDQPYDIDWLDIAPIVQEYKETAPGTIDHPLMLKSIISGACVVRTNLMHPLHEMKPLCVHVLAPVILEGAEGRLAKAFPPKLARQFRFWTFAVDHTKDAEGIVIPGIGGEIYDRLGFGDGIAKNELLPKLVEERSEST